MMEVFVEQPLAFPGSACQQEIFTDSTHVCLYVTKVLIFNTIQSIFYFVFLHKIELVAMVLMILNLDGHHNFMIGSKATTTLRTFFVHDLLALVSRERPVAVGVSDRWKVTCDT